MALVSFLGNALEVNEKTGVLSFTIINIADISSISCLYITFENVLPKDG